MCKLPIHVISYYMCAVSEGHFKVSVDSSCGGIIISSLFNIKKIQFEIKTNVFCQYGICVSDATLPSIILSGTGRVSFDQTSSAGTYEITNNGSAGNIFIGGYDGLLVDNIHVSEVF